MSQNKYNKRTKESDHHNTELHHIAHEVEATLYNSPLSCLGEKHTRFPIRAEKH